MELVANLIRYIFVLALTVEVVLIGRALVTLALEKARIAVPVAAAEE